MARGGGKAMQGNRGLVRSSSSGIMGGERLKNKSSSAKGKSQLEKIETERSSRLNENTALPSQDRNT